MCAAIREAGCEAPGSGLNEGDRQDALRVMERLACNGTDPECEVISQELRPILRHDFFAYALVRTYDERILRVVNLDFPGDFLDAIDFRAGSVTFEPLKKCLATRAPVVVRDVTQLLSGERTATLRPWPSPPGALVFFGLFGSEGQTSVGTRVSLLGALRTPG